MFASNAAIMSFTNRLTAAIRVVCDRNPVAFVLVRQLVTVIHLGGNSVRERQQQAPRLNSRAPTPGTVRLHMQAQVGTPFLVSIYC
jgi:hypothetical protein